MYVCMCVCIYIYVCVCVCVCVEETQKCILEDTEMNGNAL